MSTIHEPSTQTPPPPDADPFRYGWRYVRRVRPDGSEEFDQVPLTLEDTLHPEEDDFRVHTHGHNEDCGYLKAVLKASLAGNPSAVVLSDCRVAYDAPIRPLGPDVAVFFDATVDPDRGTFDVAEAGARPALVIEVTSPETRVNDIGIKVDYYHQAGVPLYVVVDRREVGGTLQMRLFGYRYAPGGYEPMEPDDRGRLWLEPVRLWLGIAGNRVACYDPETDQEIGDYTAISRALTDEVQARLQLSHALADVQARADAERARAEVEQARADAERARADAADRVQADLETRLRELEAELRRSRGEA